MPGLRMWTLASIVNLAKWRAYDQVRRDRVYATASVVAHNQASQNSVSLSLGLRASKSSGDRHSSSLAHFIGSSSPTSRKGKSVASPAQPTAHAHHDSAEPGYLFVDTSITLGPHTDSPSTSMPPLDQLSLANSSLVPQPPPLSDAERLATPLDWARSSVPLPLPSSSGEVLSFRLCRSLEPTHTSEDPDSSSDGYEDDPASSRRRKMQQDERDRLFLFVATPKSIFLYESRPSGRRSWTLTKEYFVRLVTADYS